MKYLYGASVQGIQNFIFKSNKLKEIIGASDLVEDICTTKFQNFAGVGPQKENRNWIQGAAGNIKYLFEEEDLCRNVYYGYPKEIMEYAPGVTISQSAVKVEGPLKKEHFDQLEKNLKIQKNWSLSEIDYGQMAFRRSRRTGSPSSAEKPGFNNNDDIPDYSTRAKLIKQGDKSELLAKFVTENNPEFKQNLFPVDFSKISGEKSWLAIVHADGNGLGMVLNKLGSELENKDENYIIEAYRDFSVKLEESTTLSASRALKEVFSGNETSIPFRPIILGGDDLTIVIRADKALDFAKYFLKYFQEETANKLGDFFLNNNMGITHLTACAGIAFAKESYPFHYSVNMSEMLCKNAKKTSKEINNDIPPASLSFYKIQSSFVDTDSFDTIIQNELKAEDGFSFDFGPYFIEESNGRPTVNQLNNWVRIIRKKGAPASRLREWVSARYKSKEHGDLLLERLLQILELDQTKKQYKNDFSLDSLKTADKTPVYDILTIASFLKKE